MEQVIQNDQMNKALTDLGFTQGAGEGRLLLAELLLKANAGYRNSHTEEAFMASFGMLRTDRRTNKKGAKYICSMFYTHSNRLPQGFDLMAKHRQL